MERRRLLAYARLGVVYPVGTVAGATGLAWLLGWDPGLVVLALSMAAAAALTAVTFAETERMRPREADRGREQRRGPLGFGGGDGPRATGERQSGSRETLPAVARSRRARLRVYSAGLFVLTATAVLVFGGAV